MTSLNPGASRVQYSHFLGGAWSPPEYASDPGGILAAWVSVDHDNNKWILYTAPDPLSGAPGDAVWASRWNGAVWGTAKVISEPFLSNDSTNVYLSVSRDRADRTRAVWVRANTHNFTRRDVVTTSWDGSEWTPVELVGILADSADVVWPDISGRGGSSTWISWMRVPDHPPYVYNIVSVHSVDISTGVEGGDFSVEANRAGVRVSWSLNSSSETIGRVLIYRARGSFASPVPVGGSAEVAEVVGERTRAGSFLDRDPGPAGAYSYWLGVESNRGSIAWQGPRGTWFAPAPPFSRLTKALPNPSEGTVLIRGVIGVDIPWAVQIFGTDGRLVRTLNVPKPSEGLQGDFTITWDGRIQSGSPAASGLYFARLMGAGPTSGGSALKIFLLR